MLCAVATYGRNNRRPKNGLERFSPSVGTAWQESLMAGFPSHVAEALLEDARETRVKAREVFYRGFEDPETAPLALIADGLVRTFIEAENGRQVTIRYAGPGDVVGAPALVAALGDEQSRERSWIGRRDSVYGEALRDTVMVTLSPTRFQRLAETEVSVASALAMSLAYRSVETEQILADGLFLSVRARVARHLLDLAVRRDSKLVVTAGHQEIADAIGSVREVVSRTLVGMREEGVVCRCGRETLLMDPAKLHEIATAG